MKLLYSAILAFVVIILAIIIIEESGVFTMITIMVILHLLAGVIIAVITIAQELDEREEK